MDVRCFLTAILLTLTASADAASTAKDPFSEMRIRRIAPPVPAVNVVLSSTEGHQIRLSDFRGKVVLVEFFVAN
jgi:cytochrome oxidase Cu insertion factor (SCO1/SenC/PrrC family)